MSELFMTNWNPSIAASAATSLAWKVIWENMSVLFMMAYSEKKELLAHVKTVHLLKEEKKE